LRPLGVGEILDVAMKIVWRNAGTLLRAVVVIVFPLEIVIVVLQASALPKNDDSGIVSSSDVAAAVGGYSVAGIVGFVANALAAGACYRAIASAYLGERTGWRESLRYALTHARSLLWLTLISVLIPLVGLIACIVPGIYLWVSFAVCVPVLLTEGKRGTSAIWRSRDLVRGSWWRTLGVVLLGTLLVSVISGVLTGLIAAVTAVGSSTGSLLWAVGTVIAGTISKSITTPFTAAFLTVLYFDLRVRKEAFDLQLLAQRIGVDPPVGYSPLPPAPPPSAQPPYWPPPPGWKPPDQ
jgi:hypothetical protein